MQYTLRGIKYTKNGQDFCAISHLENIPQRVYNKAIKREQHPTKKEINTMKKTYEIRTVKIAHPLFPAQSYAVGIHDEDTEFFVEYCTKSFSDKNAMAEFVKGLESKGFVEGHTDCFRNIEFKKFEW